MNKEKQRLLDSKNNTKWKKWGPYLSERQWGTVREDYSANGDAWNYTPHDIARSKAYRWGEEGIGGICDNKQLLCFSLVLWNEKDPILKEQLFGLTNPQGNHGEDVKEYYYYLESSPTHSYMKMLYKYPHEAFPYEKLVLENSKRKKNYPEYELIDTGVFDNNNYFDVFIEYAKNSPEDILINIKIENRSKNKATIHLLPTIWFRNTWDWFENFQKPKIYSEENYIKAKHQELGDYYFYSSKKCEQLFCENETNIKRLYGVNKKGYFKDGINDYIVYENSNAVNPDKIGTKSAFHFISEVEGEGTVEYAVRLSDKKLKSPFKDSDKIINERRKDNDEFYELIQNGITDEDEKLIQRQAFAGMMWTKQFYYYNIAQWLNGDETQPPPPKTRKHGRNNEWFHLYNSDIFSMPDKWEYPWYAAWDLAFHALPIALIDPDFAKEQLNLLLNENYLHPNGQLPAYEWSFSDVNPPVHAWAVWRVYKIDQKHNDGKSDYDFLERAYHKLLLNFTWWVNQKDKDGHNIFEGGFLGLDNIGVFDRSSKLPTGGSLEQADATSWMAMYCLNLMRISLELSVTKPVYQDMATKFLEHFLYIAGAMANIGGEGINLWDDDDKFFYDVLHLPHGELIPLRVRSMVGLIPLFAVETLEPDYLDKVPKFKERLYWFLSYRPDLTNLISRWNIGGQRERKLLSLLRGHRMKKILKRMLDETEFLSEYGVRALSKFHLENPYVFKANGERFEVHYTPGESDSRLFGGNSNWRGPIWFPVNFLIIESLQKFHHYYGDDFLVEYPTNSGNYLNINQIANELSKRLIKIFKKDKDGKRPIYGFNNKIQNDKHFKDYILFYEYFHGEKGWGLGASHQTGWTGLIAKLIQPRV